MVQNSLHLTFTLLFPDGSEELGRYDIRANQHIWTSNPHCGIIHSPYHYPYTYQRKSSFFKTQEIPGTKYDFHRT